MSDQYIMNEDHSIVKCDDLLEWMEQSNRTIKLTKGTITVGGINMGEIRISTVFLGLDHSFDSVGDPVLFETMIFGGPNDEYQDRCCTYEAALKMHEKALVVAPLADCSSSEH